jgi:hypothetical protein
LAKFYQGKKALESLSFEIEKAACLVLSTPSEQVKPAF